MMGAHLLIIAAIARPHSIIIVAIAIHHPAYIIAARYRRHCHAIIRPMANSSLS